MQTDCGFEFRQEMNKYFPRDPWKMISWQDCYQKNMDHKVMI